MARPKLKYGQITIQGKISENKVSLEVLKFVQDEIKHLGQARFVLEAVMTYYKYKSGQLLGEELEKRLLNVLPKVLEKYKVNQVAATSETSEAKTPQPQNQNTNYTINESKNNEIYEDNIEKELENMQDNGMLAQLVGLIERGEG